MCFSPRSRLVLVKLEGTEGTDAAPVVGTDDLYVLQDSAGISEGVTTIQNQPGSPTGYELKQIVGTRKPTATYRIPLYGLGEDGGGVVNLPKWLTTILGSCGHVNQDAGSGSGVQVDWTPDALFPRLTDTGGSVSATNKTFTLYDFRGRDGSVAGGIKVLHRMVGCRVASLRLVQTVGQWLVLEVDIQGLFVVASSSTTDLSAFDLDGARDFAIPNGSTSLLTLAGPTALTLRAQSTQWSIDFGAEQIEGDDIASGVSCVGTQQAVVTATVNPVIAAANINSWEVAARDQAVAAYSLTAPMTAQGRTVNTGYSINVAAPQVQFTGDNDYGSAAVRKALALRASSSDGIIPPITLSLT